MNNNELVARLQAAADIAIATGCELANIPASDALAIADLLKEQEAVRPFWAQGRAYCGQCGMPFPKRRHGNLRKYCSYCGKAVEWDAAD